MNANWKKFFKMISKGERLIVGLMSGTSLDGLDVALCAISGSGVDTKVRVTHFQTIAYDDVFKEEIRSIFSKRNADLQMISLMNEKIGTLHAEMVLNSLKKWNVEPLDVDAIGSHGQTIFHAPESHHQLGGYPNATLQIGDGDHIAVRTGIITLCDFRQKHIAAGGEGAPLAIYGDFLLCSAKGEERILLNIGGIANFTYLSADADARKAFSTDVGPGNTIMDHYVQKHYCGVSFDNNGDFAAAGRVNLKLLRALLDLDFFSAPFPKTTGPELFNLNYLEAAQQRSGTVSMNKEDVMATLNRFTAQVIIDAIQRCIKSDKSTDVYLSGGGAHNSVLVGHLKTALPAINFYTTERLGIDPDAKEAVLFAVLANETLTGAATDIGQEPVQAVTMGKICLPF